MEKNAVHEPLLAIFSPLKDVQIKQSPIKKRKRLNFDAWMTTDDEFNIGFKKLKKFYK